MSGNYTTPLNPMFKICPTLTEKCTRMQLYTNFICCGYTKKTFYNFSYNLLTKNIKYASPINAPGQNNGKLAWP